MGKRGPKPRERVSTEWTPELAYAIGLLAADGCLSPRGSHIDLTSKDLEQIENYSACLGLTAKIGKKSAGRERRGVYYHVQFKSVLFYTFLESIGLTPCKSKTLTKLQIPSTHFWDFLRGVYDGDGCSYSYWDPRWRSSFMFYTAFASASVPFLEWLQKEIKERTNEEGRIGKNSTIFQLRYAKAASLKILRGMYGEPAGIHLSRKRLKVEQFLAKVGEQL